MKRPSLTSATLATPLLLTLAFSPLRGQTSEERTPPGGAVISGGSSSSSVTNVNGKTTKNSSSSTTQTLTDGSTQTVVTTEKDGVVSTRVVTISPTGQVSVTEKPGNGGAAPQGKPKTAPVTPAPADAGKGGWLGIHVGEVADVLRAQLDIPDGQGVVVSLVAPDSPAKKAGLEPNDILLEMDGRALKSVEAFRTQLGNAKVGQRVDFRYLRKGQPGNAGAILQDRPAGADAGNPAAVNATAPPARKATVLQDGAAKVVEGAEALSEPFKMLLDDPNVPETMKEQLRRTQEEFRKAQSGVVNPLVTPAAPAPAKPAPSGDGSI